MSHHPLHKFICPIIGFISLLAQPLLADGTFGDFSYSVNGNAITITSFNDSTQSKVVVPAEIKDHPVTSIGMGAFQNCSNLVSVSIPVGVTHIDKEAFVACSSLMDVSLPNGLTSIGETAFGYCPFLSRIDIPESVKFIGRSAFLTCPRLRKVSLPSRLKIIDSYTFAECGSLVEISIPNGVSTIKEGAFYNCKDLRIVRFPDNLETLGENAFSGCVHLEKVLLPSHLARIGGYAFAGAANLTDATFLGNAPVMAAQPFAGTGKNFTAYYREGSEGFTSPIWRGYPTAIADLSPKFEVCQPARTPLVDGSAQKNFGMVAVDETRTKTFTIRNTGKTRLAGLDVTITGPDAGDFKVFMPFKTSLRIDDATNFKVTFAPSGKGDHEAVIHVKCKGITRNPMDIRVSGTGVK